MKKEILYHYSLTVEFEDVDSYHIAHHSKLIAYLERARVHFFSSRGIDVQSMHYGLVVYKVESRFIKPARFLDNLSVEINGISLDAFSVTVHQRIMQGTDVLVKASVVHAFVSNTTGATIPMPADFRMHLAVEQPEPAP